uniref:Amino acid transporter transmembrane domain-containing protein n=1 Tax=Electrophorus electricus TaxID=8005 RepID=A0A4W4GA38_ELEEL
MMETQFSHISKFMHILFMLHRFDSLSNMEVNEHFLPRMEENGKTHFTDSEGKTSFGMSIFNLSNAIMGSGILGLAYAMANTGIVLFLILLILIAVMSAYSIHLLLKSADVVGTRAYEMLGLRAYGQAGKIIAACVVTIHNIGAMSTYLYIVKIELPFVILGLLGKEKDFGGWYVDGNYLITIVSVCVILPLALMRRLGYLGYTSGVSLLCMVFFLISVSLAIYSIPIVAFAFVCHPEVLPIYTELRKPTKKRMQNVANISILAMFIMYLLTAVFGYLTFYGNVEDELLKSYSASDTLILCVRLAVLVAVTLTVPVVLFPIRRTMLQLCCPNKPFCWATHISMAIGLLIFVNVLVIFVPNIKDIFGFIGATTAPSLIFILPGIFYIRLIPHTQEPVKSRPKILAFMFSGLGFVFMFGSISLIIQKWMTGNSPDMKGH